MLGFFFSNQLEPVLAALGRMGDWAVVVILLTLGNLHWLEISGASARPSPVAYRAHHRR